MKVTATEFRKNLFRLMDKAINGEFIEVEHKGRSVRLVAEDRPSKMSRLVRRNILNCSPEELEAEQQTLSKQMHAEWEAKWDERLKR